MIALNALSFSYGRKRLFSGLSLSLPPGNICGLLGRNGAGKTTLLKLLAGLLFPQDGETGVLGERPARRSPGFLQDLTLLPEEFSLPSVSPALYRRLYAPFYPRFSPQQYHDYLNEFDLDPNENLDRCSYGQKKKFLIAFGFAAGCRLTLLDEPTNGLDIPSKRQFRQALASVLTEDRLFIIATHQARDLESLIDPVVILDEGQVIFNRSMEEISKGLSVRLRSEPPRPGEDIYCEKTLEGYLVVAENRTDEESHIDLELLFNAVIQRREKVSTLFQKEGLQ